MQALDLLVRHLRALLERREARLPEDLVDPGAADPGDRPLVAQQRMQVPRLVDAARRARSSGGAGHASGPSVATISSSPTSAASMQLAPRPAASSRTRAAAARDRPRGGSGPASAGPSARRARGRAAAAPRTSCGRAGPAARPRGRPRPRASCRRGERLRSRARPAPRAAGSTLFSATIPGASVDSTRPRAAPRRAGGR